MAAIAGTTADPNDEKSTPAVTQFDELIAKALDGIRRNTPRRFAYFIKKFGRVPHELPSQIS